MADAASWLIALAVLAAVFIWLYRQGRGGARPRRVKGEDHWATLQTALAGEAALQPLARHLAAHNIAVRLTTEKGPAGRPLGKLAVRRRDLARARELAARFDMHRERVSH